MTSERNAGYRLHDWRGELRWDEIPLPEVGPRDLLIEVEACGIGRTVINAIAGDLGDDPRLLPRVPGHEVVGRVAEVGREAPTDLLGRRVVSYFYLSCARCSNCLAGRESLCEASAGYLGVHRDGGYAPKMTLPAFNAIPIDDAIDPVDATVIPDAVATSIHIIGRAGIDPSDRVAILGAGGGVGIHLVQLLQALGATVLGLDVTESKLSALEALGVPAADARDLGHAGDRMGAQGPTVVVDLVGRSVTQDWAIEKLDSGGRYVVLTTFRKEMVSQPSREIVFRELTLLGSRYATRDEVAHAANVVASRVVQPKIGAKTGPQGIPTMHDQLTSGMVTGRAALVWG